MQAANAQQILEGLNRDYVRAAQEADLRWYEVGAQFGLQPVA